MFKIAIADLVIEIDNRYSHIEHYCKGYITVTDKTDLRVSVTTDEIVKYATLAGRDMPFPLAETILTYRRICTLIPSFDAFLFHAAVVVCRGRSYAFSASRGTGKTTHAMMWLKKFGSDAAIINGDKPIIRFDGESGKPYAFGTPWCGKEGYNVNSSVALNGIVFIERSADGKNSGRRITDYTETVTRMMEQVIVPVDCGLIDTFVSLIKKFVLDVPAYVLYVTPDVSSAEFAEKFLREV